MFRTVNRSPGPLVVITFGTIRASPHVRNSVDGACTSARPPQRRQHQPRHVPLVLRGAAQHDGGAGPWRGHHGSGDAARCQSDHGANHLGTVRRAADLWTVGVPALPRANHGCPCSSTITVPPARLVRLLPGDSVSNAAWSR